jgi:hypothetical protein
VRRQGEGWRSGHHEVEGLRKKAQPRPDWIADWRGLVKGERVMEEQTHGRGLTHQSCSSTCSLERERAGRGVRQGRKERECTDVVAKSGEGHGPLP